MKLLIAVIVIGAVIATVAIYKSNTVRNQTVIEETIQEDEWKTPPTDCLPHREWND
jgi:uncharacterized membrane protein YdjX (TVP38/TMEM64 family)